jgi:hypothetical protein
MQIRIIFNVVQERYPVSNASEKNLLKLKSPGTPKTSFNPISDNRRRMYSEIVMVGIGEIGRLMFDGFQVARTGLYICFSWGRQCSVVREHRQMDLPLTMLYHLHIVEKLWLGPNNWVR